MSDSIEQRLAALKSRAMEAWGNDEGKRLMQEQTAIAMMKAGRLTTNANGLIATDPEDADAMLVSAMIRLTTIQPAIMHRHYTPAPDEDHDPVF